LEENFFSSSLRELDSRTVKLYSRRTKMKIKISWRNFLEEKFLLDKDLIS
jgi:hypothetical protein